VGGEVCALAVGAVKGINLMSKKKKSNTPRAKRMTRQSRLSSGKHWLAKHKGQKTVRAYAKHYGVDRLCALLELRILGLSISEEEIENARRMQASANKKKTERTSESIYEDSGDMFCFIAGYTPGGLPYGVTWEEADEQPD
jgi:hypothetical protein